MKSNRSWRYILFLWVLILSVYSIRSVQATQNRSNGALYKEPITIGVAPWPGYLALYVANGKGYFKEEGLDVRIKNYPGLAELSKDYVAGKLQGRANLTLDAVNEYLSGLDHKIVFAIDYSNGSDAIIAGKGISSIKDLKGKRVGYEIGTLEEFFLTWALTKNELQLSDITGISATPEETINLLKDGQVDVGVSYEPFISKLISPGGEFHVIYSSANAPGLITDILTFRTDFIEAHPETVQAIVNAYSKALNFWKENPGEACAIVAKAIGDTPEGIARQLKGIKVLDERDNESAFTFSTGLQSLYGNLRQIEKFLRTQKKSNLHPLDTDKLVDRRFAKELNVKYSRKAV